MSRAPTDLATTWAQFSPCLERLFHFDKSVSGCGLSFHDWMLYFNMVYTYCTNVSTSIHPPANYKAAVVGSLRNIAGMDFYERLKAYLTTFCEHLKTVLISKTGDELLQDYNAHWLDYLFSRKLMDHICHYLNRHCVTRAQEAENSTPIHGLAQLAIAVWRDILFMPLKDKLVHAMLDLVERDRNGLPIHTTLVSNAVQCMAALGLHDETGHVMHGPVGEAAPTGQDLSIYTEHFEKCFLEVTGEYYTKESQAFLAVNAVTDYMKKVEKRIEEEDKRVSNFLHDSTRSKLMKKICDVLIKNYLDIFNHEVKTLLETERNTDLHRMFKLLSRVDDGVTSLRKSLEDHVVEQGRAAVEACGTITLSSEDAKRYVETLLDVQKRYLVLVKTAFNEDPDFSASLDKACRSFVNSNAVTKTSKASRSPELLAKYCDSLLKKSAKNPEEQQLEVLLSDIMTVFCYLEDKDVFEKFYKKFLANRLVTGKSISDDAESTMISKLKAQSGHEYTAKLQRMFIDMESSKNLNTKFKEHLVKAQTKLGLDFNVQVLTQNTWPYTNQFTLNMPQNLLRCMDRFNTFYTKEHEGRKLMWLYQLCKGELKTLYTKKPHILEASTVQMVALLQFNEAQSQPLDKLVQAVGLEAKLLDQHLECLVKMKLLFLRDGVYTVNEKYNHKKVRLKVDQPLKAEQKAESDETHKTAEEDRKFVIQASIVRIMKARKAMAYKLLLNEVILDLEKRFKPKISDIKRNIDSLIEQEYLRRKDNSHDELEYLA